LHALRLINALWLPSGANALKDQAMTKPDTPFPKHWLYYIVLKYAIIAAAVLIALYVVSQLRDLAGF
jgi:hypothetical protein